MWKTDNYIMHSIEDLSIIYQVHFKITTFVSVLFPSSIAAPIKI